MTTPVIPHSLSSLAFWLDTTERALRSFAQGTLAALGVGSTSHVAPGVSVPWDAALAFGGILAIMSVLTSIASIAVPGSDPQNGSFFPPYPVPEVKMAMWWRRLIRRK